MTTYANPALAALVRNTVVVTETVITVVEPAPMPVIAAVVPQRTDLMVQGEVWTWEQLRDYVVAQIVAVSGPFTRSDLRESGIFKGFVKRYGADASRIAKAAFEVYHGYWRSAPVSVSRFTQGNDDYFAKPILASLDA